MKRYHFIGLMSLVIILSISSTNSAQETKKPFLPLKTDEPPVIDGVLDDEVWQKCLGFKTHRTNRP